MSDHTRGGARRHTEETSSAGGGASNITMGAAAGAADPGGAALQQPVLPEGIMPYYLAKMSPAAADAAVQIGSAEVATAPAPRPAVANVNDPTSVGSPAHRALGETASRPSR